MTKLAVIVTSSPLDNLTVTAINIITAALTQGVDVIGVFFYQNGVINANKNIEIPTDEFQCLNAWRQLHQHYNLPLHLCVTAGEKRGLLVADTDTENIDPAFTISGLGELVELANQADRILQL